MQTLRFIFIFLGSTPKQLVDCRVNKEDLPLFGRQHQGTWGDSEHCAMLPDGGYIILIDAVVLKWPRHGRAALNPKELLSLFTISSPTLLDVNHFLRISGP
jgi:hypothetical protein